MGIIHERRRTVPSFGILAMAAGAGRVEIAHGLDGFARAGAGGRVFLGPNLENRQRGHAGHSQSQGKFLHRMFPTFLVRLSGQAGLVR